MAILISTPQQLHNIRNDLSASYELINEIDMSGWGQWTPIVAFTGTFDGKGHVISNLIDNLTSLNDRAIFGSVTNATIQNVGLENVTFKGGSRTGSLVGNATNSIISSCYATGDVRGGISTGGLVGYSASSDISNSYANVTVYGSGGSTTTRTGTGGLVGNSSVDSTVKNSYSSSHISNASDTASGLIGANNTATTFPTVTNSFWDINVSGVTTSKGGGTGKTTTQMKTQSTYVNWDFKDTWLFENDYPTLKVFSNVVPVNRETINVNSLVKSIHSKINKSRKSTQISKSYSDNILSHSNVRRATIRSIEIYSLPIESNATQSNRIVKSKTVNVLSSISPIHSTIDNYGKRVVHVASHINQIQAVFEVVTSMRDIPVFAYASVLENQVATSSSEHLSQLSIVENPSTTLNRKNISHLSSIENPSFLEVI